MVHAGKSILINLPAPAGAVSPYVLGTARPLRTPLVPLPTTADVPYPRYRPRCTRSTSLRLPHQSYPWTSSSCSTCHGQVPLALPAKDKSLLLDQPRTMCLPYPFMQAAVTLCSTRPCISLRPASQIVSVPAPGVSHYRRSAQHAQHVPVHRAPAHPDPPIHRVLPSRRCPRRSHSACLSRILVAGACAVTLALPLHVPCAAPHPARCAPPAPLPGRATNPHMLDWLTPRAPAHTRFAHTAPP